MKNNMRSNESVTMSYSTQKSIQNILPTRKTIPQWGRMTVGTLYLENKHLVV